MARALQEVFESRRAEDIDDFVGELLAHLNSLQEQARAADVEYFRTTTDQPVEELLLRFISGRSRAAASRAR